LLHLHAGHYLPKIQLLLPGQSITKTVKVCLTPPCKQPFCFFVSVHDTNFNKCCSIYHCLSPVNGALKLVTPPDNSDFTSPVNIGLSAIANPAVGITQVVFYANDAAVANGTPDSQGTGAYNGVWSKRSARLLFVDRPWQQQRRYVDF
jgi:hypothetical protein